MKHAADLRTILRGEPVLMTMLTAVSTINLPDCWIAAGAIRSAVWDVLHGWSVSSDWADVDVLFFDSGDVARDKERAAETELAILCPGPWWEVRNQARMHRKVGNPPYCDTEDGLRHFAETPTAVGVRLVDGSVDILAPHGLDDLFSCTVKPTATDDRNMAFYRARMAAKNWPGRWPKVRVLDL